MDTLSPELNLTCCRPTACPFGGTPITPTHPCWGCVATGFQPETPLPGESPIIQLTLKGCIAKKNAGYSRPLPDSAAFSLWLMAVKKIRQAVGLEQNEPRKYVGHYHKLSPALEVVTKSENYRICAKFKKYEKQVRYDCK